MIRYCAARGARLSHEQAQRYGERIHALMAGNGDELQPAAILRDARKKRSPLHDYFEWDDEAAAEQHRLNQARYLLRHIVIRVEDGEEEQEVRAFYHVTDPPEDDAVPLRKFVTLARVVEDDEYHAQQLRKAVAEVRAWQARTRTLKELTRIHEAIEETMTVLV